MSDANDRKKLEIEKKTAVEALFASQLAILDRAIAFQNHARNWQTSARHVPHVAKEIPPGEALGQEMLSIMHDLSDISNEARMTLDRARKSPPSKKQVELRIAQMVEKYGDRPVKELCALEREVIMERLNTIVAKLRESAAQNDGERD